jgi:uncharacterized protein YuzE
VAYLVYRMPTLKNFWGSLPTLLGASQKSLPSPVFHGPSVKMTEAFPSLFLALREALIKANQLTLLEQIEASEVQGATFDKTVVAGYVYLGIPSGDHRTPALQRKSAKTVEIDTPYWTIVDLDLSGQVIGIEILRPEGLRAPLEAYIEKYL